MQLTQKNKTVFFLSLAISLLCGCTKLVNDEFELYDKTPVLNSLLISDSTININLSYTEKPDSTQVAIIDNAEISIFVDGELQDISTRDENGNYLSDIIVEPLKNYSIEAMIPGFDTIKAGCTVPKQYKILNIEHSNFSYITEDGIICPGMKITFENDPTQELYFEIKIKLFTRNNRERYAPLIGKKDHVIENEGLPIALFSNELMDKNQYTIMLNYFSMSVSGNQCDIFPFIVELRSVSYEYYQFARKMYMYENSFENNDISGVIIPVQVFSNIENGSGIFAAYSSYFTDTIIP